MTAEIEELGVTSPVMPPEAESQSDRLANDLIAELRFLEAWQHDRIAYLSGIVRVRQFHRAQPALAAACGKSQAGAQSSVDRARAPELPFIQLQMHPSAAR